MKEQRNVEKFCEVSERTWEEKLASERGAPSAQELWNLGLSSVPHNQTNAANTKQAQTQV